MLPLLSFLHPFGDRPLQTLIRGRRPFWVARHLGRHLDTPPGAPPLPHRMLAEWGDAFAHGHDFALVQGGELRELRAAMSAAGLPVGTGERGLVLVVYETGLALALDRLGTDAARDLRRFLIDVVLPDVHRNAPRITISAMAAARPAGGHRSRIAPPSRRRPGPAVPLSLRSTLARCVDLEDRRFQVDALRRVAEKHGDHLDPGASLALDLVCAEVATGLNLLPLFRPEDDEPSEPTPLDPGPTDRNAA